MKSVRPRRPVLRRFGTPGYAASQLPLLEVACGLGVYCRVEGSHDEMTLSGWD